MMRQREGMVHPHTEQSSSERKDGGAKGLHLRNESDLGEDWQAGQERLCLAAIGNGRETAGQRDWIQPRF